MDLSQTISNYIPEFSRLKFLDKQFGKFLGYF